MSDLSCQNRIKMKMSCPHHFRCIPLEPVHQQRKRNLPSKVRKKMNEIVWEGGTYYVLGLNQNRTTNRLFYRGRGGETFPRLMPHLSCKTNSPVAVWHCRMAQVSQALSSQYLFTETYRLARTVLGSGQARLGYNLFSRGF